MVRTRVRVSIRTKVRVRMKIIVEIRLSVIVFPPPLPSLSLLQP